MYRWGQQRIEEGNCRLLPDRQHRLEVLPRVTDVGSVMDAGRAFDPTRAVDPERTAELLAQGYFGAGLGVFRARCRECSACVPFRIPVRDFRASESQRRLWRRNQDVAVEIGPPRADAESLELSNRQAARDGEAAKTFEEYRRWCAGRPFLVEFRYLLEARLQACGHVLPAAGACASLRLAHEPDGRRRWGIFSVLVELDWARRQGFEHFYLGAWTQGSDRMKYKLGFRPHELQRGGRWEGPA